MSWKDLGGTIKKFAPILGTVIGGPAGGAIGGVVSAVASAFGIEKSEPEPDELAKAIAADPESAVKLKKIEMDHKTELEKLAIETDRMYLADRANARSREMAIVKATGEKDWNLYILAWIVIAGFFGLCVLLMQITLPAGSNEVVFMLFGALASGFGQVLQYFFGSSKSSASKTEMLAKKV